MNSVSFRHRDIEPFFVDSSAACMSQDGRVVATAAGEDVYVVDVEKQAVLAKVAGDGEQISSLTITPDGRYVGIFSQSQQFRVWDVAGGLVRSTVRLSAPVFMSRADATSTLFAYGGSDGVVTVWDVEGGYVTHALKGHGTTICSLAFFGDNGTADWRLASGDIMGTVKVWDLVKRKCVATVREHSSAARGLCFDGRGQLVSGGRDGVVVVYSDKYRPTKSFPVRHQVEAVGVVSVGGEECVYSAGSGSTWWVWDKSGAMVGHLTKMLETTEELMVTDVFARDGLVWLVMSDQTLVEVSVFPEQQENDGVLEFPVVQRLAGNHGTVADVRYVGPRRRLLALATNSPALRIVDPDAPLAVSLCETHTDLLNALAVLSDGLWVATAGKDGLAVLWQWSDDALLFAVHSTYHGHAGSVTAVALSQENPPKFLITGSDDLTIKKWPVGKGGAVKTAQFTRRAHEKDINSISVSPNDEHFASASYDKTAKIWSTSSGDTVGVLRGHRRGLWNIEFCQYAPMVVTSSGDKTAKVWSLQDYTCTATLEGHTNGVQRAIFVRENHQIVTCGADGLVKIWTTSGENLATLDNHENRIWALAAKDDGDKLVSCDGDGYMTIWTDNSEETRAENEAEIQKRVEQEQKLRNCIDQQDYSGAFLLALTLDHPMRLYLVVRSSMELGPDLQLLILGLKSLETTISALTDDQVLLVMKRAREWNVNFRTFDVSQRLVRVILAQFAPTRLTSIRGIIPLVDGLVAYNERHYARIDSLIEQSYMLDYAVAGMGK